MRFSLKWILVGMAYAAVAAAAFSQTTWVYADVLWAASLLAVVYAGLIAAFARGRRQVAAAGFVVASVGFCVCLYFANDSVPTRRLLAAARVGEMRAIYATSHFASGNCHHEYSERPGAFDAIRAGGRGKAGRCSYAGSGCCPADSCPVDGAAAGCAGVAVC